MYLVSVAAVTKWRSFYYHRTENGTTPVCKGKRTTPERWESVGSPPGDMRPCFACFDKKKTRRHAWSGSFARGKDNGQETKED